MNNEVSTDKFEYLNKEPLDKNFKCPICTYPLINPVSTNCKPESHTFCSNCIDQHVKTNPSCPICDQKLDTEDLTPITTVNFIRFLNSLLVKCLACEQTDLKRIDFDAHYNEICPKVKIQCPSSDNNCSWKGTRHQLKDHLKICIIDIIKPLLDAFQNNSEQQQVTIIQLQARIEQLMSEKNQLQEKLKRSVTLPEWPKPNAQQKQSAQPGNVDIQINKEITVPQASSILNKLDQNRIQAEGIIKKNKQLSGGINQVAFQNTALQDTIKQMQTRLEQYLAVDPGKAQKSHIDRHTNKKHGNNPGSHTENNAYFPVPRATPNIPVHTSGYGQHFPPNYSNTNPSSATAQNTLNHPGMEPFIIPISISISVNTNIVQENTGTNNGHTNNNVVGGNSISICAGNINIGGGCHNNIAGGSNNKIAGGNNYGCGSNNNPVAGINNAGGGIGNSDVHANNGGTNNPGGIISGGVGSNNRAGNNITGNGNNIAGGNYNTIVSGIINMEGNSNNIAGGYNNCIASGNNIADNNNNYNGRNDTPNDDGSEDSTNSLVDHPNDERWSETSYIDDRLRENPDEPHPPYRNNRWD